MYLNKPSVLIHMYRTDTAFNEFTGDSDRTQAQGNHLWKIHLAHTIWTLHLLHAYVRQYTDVTT